MKNLNKIVGFLTLMALSLQACKDKKTDVPAPTPVSNSTADFIKQNTTASQNFRVNISNSDTIITGQKGTIIQIPKNAFVTMNGQPVSGLVNIEMKEIFSKSEMVLSSIPTISNGKLLVSGGEVYINATTVSGELLKIDTLRGLTVQVPNNNVPQNGMTLFTGNQNGNNFTWQPVQVDTSYYSPYDTLYHPLPSFQKINGHYVFTLRNLGWTNCDRFWNFTNFTTVKIDCQKFNTFANVYVVFKKEQCAIQLQEGTDGIYTSDGTGSLLNLPVGEDATVVAVAITNGKSYYTMTDITITQNFTTTLELTETNEQDIVNAIKQKCD